MMHLEADVFTKFDKQWAWSRRGPRSITTP